MRRGATWCQGIGRFSATRSMQAAAPLRKQVVRWAPTAMSSVVCHTSARLEEANVVAVTELERDVREDLAEVRQALCAHLLHLLLAVRPHLCGAAPRSFRRVPESTPRAEDPREDLESTPEYPRTLLMTSSRRPSRFEPRTLIESNQSSACADQRPRVECPARTDQRPVAQLSAAIARACAVGPSAQHRRHCAARGRRGAPQSLAASGAAHAAEPPRHAARHA
jgi:hypothetical protein